jgi:hypothetical protein
MIMPETKTATRKRPFWRRRWVLFAGIPAAIAGAIVLPRALAYDGWQGHGVHRFGGFHGRHCPFTGEEVRERIDRKLDFVLGQLDATAGQEKAIREIVDQSIPEMTALHERGRALREQFAQALLGKKVDREELQRIQEEIRLLTDQVSDLAVERLGAIAEELDAQQRGRVLAFIQAHH